MCGGLHTCTVGVFFHVQRLINNQYSMCFTECNPLFPAQGR